MKRTPLRSRSLKLQRAMAVYRRDRELFLEANPVCQHPTNHSDGNVRATCVHHRRGRFGRRLLDQRYWAASCASCNDEAETDTGKSLACGWLLWIEGLPNEGGAGDGVTEQGEAGRDTAALSPRDGVDSHDVGPVTSEATPAVMRGGAGEPCARPAPSGGAA